MNISTEDVTFPANGGTAQGYLAMPEGAPRGGVVVIQEWWGVDEHIKDVTRRFAAEGYVALAPDLYHGAVTSEPDEAMKLVMALQLPEAAQEMAGAAAYVAERTGGGPKKVAAIGFCLGGSLALVLAAGSPHIGAVASYYGGREVPEEQLRRITAPVLAIFGEADQGIPPERHALLDRVFTDMGLLHAIYVYPGAPHAFFNDTRPEIYRPLAAQDAWARTLAWFAKYVGQ